MNIAIDCKQTEFEVTVIAPCEVAGVAYGTGETIRMATKAAADKLVAKGIATHTGALVEVDELLPIMGTSPVSDVSAEESYKKVVAEAKQEKPAKAGSLVKRVERSKTGKS